MRKIAIKIIRLYQKTLSPDHGWFSSSGRRVCRFEPTCSEYTINAINKYGLIRGFFRGVWRILRCNPWNKGGLDPA